MRGPRAEVAQELKEILLEELGDLIIIEKALISVNQR